MGSTLVSAPHAQSCVPHPCAGAWPVLSACASSSSLPLGTFPTNNLFMSASSVVAQQQEPVQRKKWQLPSPLPCSASAAGEASGPWGLQVTAGRCLDTTLTWDCQGRDSVTEATSTDEQGCRRVLRRNAVLAKDATSEYHTSILANNIGEAFTPTRGCAKK